MAVDISKYVGELTGDLSDEAYKASDALGRIGSEDVVDAMINLLSHSNSESRVMAARTLGLIEHNSKGLEPLMEAIQQKDNSHQTGDLMAGLEGFDVSAKYVEIFKLYLFGSFKTSIIAKDLLDHKEFDITARVLKKATKHWNHYASNVKQDESFLLRKKEVEDIFEDINDYIDSL